MDSKPGPSGSKYFKPGYIFKHNNQATNDDDVDDDLNCEDLDELISQASQKFASSKTAPKPSTLKAPAGSLARVNQLESQPVDFTATTTRSTPIPSLKGNNVILVNSNQRQNPLLQQLRFSRYAFNDSISPAHYLLFDSCCALFLSLKYHVIHPSYIYDKVAELRNKYQLKILLVLVDHLIYEPSLKELTLMAVRTNFTLLVAWSYEEAARHLDNYRMNAEKPPDAIMGRNFEDNSKNGKGKNLQSLTEALTSVKAVNRTDAITLLSTFETLENLVSANTDELTICPGISMVKARRLHTLFNKPFIKK